MNNKCIICVHNHKQEISKIEQLSLFRLLDFCHKNDYLDNLMFIIPESFDFDTFFGTYILKYFNDNNIIHEVYYYRFDDACFASLNAYNNALSLSSNYYGCFSKDYDYMLTYQLDGYVFNNDLEYFLSKKYDYIGGYYLPIYADFTKHKRYENIDTERHLIMNSGVSLKNIRFCIDSINKHYYEYLDGCEFNHIHSYINDDTFFSMFYTTEVSALESIKFSLNWAGAETHYAINNFEYPFCCHGINRSAFLMKLVEKYNNEHNLNYEKYIKD